MKSLGIKDKRYRFSYQKHEPIITLFRMLKNSQFLTFQHRQELYFSSLYVRPSCSSYVRIVNRCIVTNRSKSVYRAFKLSRHSFRELALSGSILGVTKSSW
jgi:ribosomal protein S14